MSNRWRAHDLPEIGFMNRVSAMLNAAELSRSDSLPDIRTGPSLVIGSDYSGQHKTSTYEALSFLIADWFSSPRWHIAQATIRKGLIADDRRFGFKHMNDRVRLAVLPRLLSAADEICGLLLVVLVHKSVGRLFTPGIMIDPQDEQLSPLTSWPAPAFERALGICNFVALLLAGLSREGQHVLWITDADDIVANEARHRQFITLFKAVSAPYLKHDLGHIRIATTASDTGKRDVEDFVSIADLAAGAVCDTLNSYDQDQMRPLKGVISPVPERLRPTTRSLMNWWADRDRPLKRLTLCIEPGSSPTKLLISHVDFPSEPRARGGA